VSAKTHACQWFCTCPEPAAARVWMAGCVPGCQGHLLCRHHGNGRAGGVVRSEPLPAAPADPSGRARLGER
jgi:hypothetical protein